MLIVLGRPQSRKKFREDQKGRISDSMLEKTKIVELLNGRLKERRYLAITITIRIFENSKILLSNRYIFVFLEFQKFEIIKHTLGIIILKF